jgi:hypothetical protein
MGGALRSRTSPVLNGSVRILIARYRTDEATYDVTARLAC